MKPLPKQIKPIPESDCRPCKSRDGDNKGVGYCLDLKTPILIQKSNCIYYKT